MPEGEAQGDDRCSYQHGLYECRYLLIYEEFLYHLGVSVRYILFLWNFNSLLGHGSASSASRSDEVQR